MKIWEKNEEMFFFFFTKHRHTKTKGTHDETDEVNRTDTFNSNIKTTKN